MRIALPHQKQGLNDEGVMPANMKTIAREVEKFSSWLARKKEGQETKAALLLFAGRRKHND
jgi:hypothetical protein